MTPAAPSLPIPFLGYSARLAEPGALRLLLVVVAVAALGAWALWRRQQALRAAAGALAPRIAPGANVARPAT